MAQEVIVLDPGSSSFKAGFSGQDLPQSSFPSVWVEGQEHIKPDKSRRPESNVEEGDDQGACRHHPIVRGSVVDFDHFEKLVEAAFENELRVNPAQAGLPVLVTEPPLNTKENREKLLQLFFETFKVPGLCLANSAVLSLFCSGRTRGVTVEVGGGISSAVPIFEGFALPHATMRLQVAGQDVTRALQERLSQKGQTVSFDSARELKEKMCFVAPANKTARSEASNHSSHHHHHNTTDYELPDGTIVRLDSTDRSSCTEILFHPPQQATNANERPGTSSESDGGIADITAKCIEMCDRDLQPDLLRNIVMAGASIIMPGFADRMKTEVHQLFPSNSLIKVTPDPLNREPGSNWQRKHAAWIGGSMFASLDTFNQVMVTSQEWEDNHESVISRKCI